MSDVLAAQSPDEAAGFAADEPWQAAWIWGQERTHGPLGCFRKVVTVGEGLRSAWAQMSGDDGYTLFVNGKEAYRGGFWWKTTNRADLLPVLHSGRNVLAAHVRNAAHPGGFLLQADLVYADGRHEVVVTDTTWRFRGQEPPADWLSPEFDDSAWETCASLGSPPGASPWGEMPLRYLGPRFAIELVRADFPRRLRAGSALALRLTLRPREAPGPVRGATDRPTPGAQGRRGAVRAHGATALRHILDVSLQREGRTLIARSLPVRVSRAAWESGKPIALPPVSLPVGAYAPGGTYRLLAGLRHSRYTGASAAGTALGSVEVVPRKPAGAITEARVRDLNGAPTLFLAGKPHFPLWYLQAPPLEEDAVAFHRAGVDVLTAPLPLGWIGPGKYDYAEVDELIARVLQWNPRAYLVPRVMVSAPEAWLDAHPEEVVRMADGTAWVGNVLGGTKHESFASPLWRQEASEALRRLVRHILAAPYSDRVIGYHVANGIYGEWHAWSAPNYPDTSEPMRRAFAEHARRKYGGDADVLRKAWGDRAAAFDSVYCPTVAERTHGDLGPFRDPGRSCRVADYYEALHEASGEAIEGLCRAVKEETRGKLFTLVFYGYWPDLGWASEGDHRALARVARSPYVDCFSSPHSYSRRALGQDGLFRNHPAALALQGKLFIDEGDDRTHLANDPTFTHVKDLNGSVAVIRRQFANALTHNVGLWYMDQQGNWFHDPAIMAEVARAKRWGEFSLRLPRKRTTQVAVVVSEQGAFHMAGPPSGRDHVTVPLYVGQIGELARAGAPFDTYLVDDLADPRMPDYACYVMLDAFRLTGAQRDAIKRKAMRAGTTVLWLYAPGFVTESGLSVDAMSDLTGIRLALQPEGEKLRLTLRTGDHPLLRSLKEPLAFGVDAVQAPAFTVADPDAVALAAYEGDGAVGMAAKDVSGCRSVYCGAPLLPASMLRELYRTAGVHVYSHSGDPLSANESFLAIHTATGGSKRFNLPQARPVYDVFAEKLLSRRAKSFTVEIPEHETRLYFLGVPERAPGK